MADGDRISGEAEVVAMLAPLAKDFAGAFGLSDDCAALTPEPGRDLVLKTDAIAEGVHFFADDSAADIGWKALAVNVSDLAAKAATPRVYLMALSFPVAPTRAWLAGFTLGLEAAQASFGIVLAGGDTDRRPGPLSIALTVIGDVPTGRMVRRGTARPGDRLFVSGTLGDAALGLALRRVTVSCAAWGLDELAGRRLIGRYLRPQPRLALRQALLAHAHAAMDLSDGLMKDLGRMAAASGAGALVRLDLLPLSDPAIAALRHDARILQAIVGGGDDYEVLAAIPADRADDFIADAALVGVPVTEIGAMTADSGHVALQDAGGRTVPIAEAGWDHF